MRNVLVFFLLLVVQGAQAQHPTGRWVDGSTRRCVPADMYENEKTPLPAGCTAEKAGWWLSNGTVRDLAIKSAVSEVRVEAATEVPVDRNDWLVPFLVSASVTLMLGTVVCVQNCEKLVP